MGIPQSRRDVEPEVFVVFDDVFPETKMIHAALLEDVLLQHRLQHRVHVFADVLQQHLSKANKECIVDRDGLTDQRLIQVQKS